MRNRPDTAMIFCAGRGTRMRHLTEHQPKPMLRVAGLPLVDHAIAQLGAVQRRVANLHYLPDHLRDHLVPQGVETIFEPQLLETGGGLKNAVETLGRETVFTTNTDAVWKGPLATDILAEAWNPDRMDALLLTIPHTRAHGFLGRGDVSYVDGTRLAWGRDEIFTGVQIIKLRTVLDEPDAVFSLKRVWERLESQGRLAGVTYPGHWADVGHVEGIQIAERMLENENV